MKVSLHNTIAKYVNVQYFYVTLFSVLGPIVQAVSLIPLGLYVAADWADISDTPTKQEKTYLKPCCTQFPGNM